MLHREVLPGAVLRVFDAVATLDAAEGLTLVGGTALALQIGHRVSLDLDFASDSERLPAQRLDKIIEGLKAAGVATNRVTDPAKDGAFRIQRGEPIGNFSRDYVCDGVKLQFFAHGHNKAQRDYYQAQERIVAPGMSFGILCLDGLKTAKTLVLADRVRSRDLYDVMILLRDHGYSVEEALKRAAALGANNDPEHYKAVMRGDIPLDSMDEGLAPVGVQVNLAQIYAFLAEQVSRYERDVARQIFEAPP